MNNLQEQITSALKALLSKQIGPFTGLEWLGVAALCALPLLFLGWLIKRVSRFGGRPLRSSSAHPVMQQIAARETELGKGGNEKVLVVDDEPIVAETTATVLKRLGYKVSIANTGEEAVAFLKEKNVDIVLLDIILGAGIDGVETLRQIREFKPKQKVMIVSGWAQPSRVKQCSEMGAGTYLIKPVTLAMLAHTIRTDLDA